jgi:hypothetical protein
MVKMCAKDLDDIKQAVERDRNETIGASA